MDIKIVKPTFKPIKVEKGINMPISKTLYTILPFHEMEVGDSFFVERGRFGKKHFFQIRAFIYQKQKEYAKETGCLDRFITKIDRLKDGIRCWRIE